MTMDSSVLTRTIIAPELPRSPAGEPEQANVASLPFRSLAIELRSHRYRADAVKPGDRLGRYEIAEHIGTGGFSSIHRARHIYLDHQVAIKTLNSTTNLAAESFLREAQALALLDHPNVVRVFDADISSGVPFIVMELITGSDLTDVLCKYKRLSVQITMDLMEELGSVLVKQEEKRLLHLDIKPANIFQRLDGSFCLFDYGLVGVGPPAKASPLEDFPPEPFTLFQQAFGTPAYMPPEQAFGKGRPPK
jgi:serine/threonine protein kinase